LTLRGTFEIGERNEFPVIASDIIYEGAAVGIVKASGHARPLTAVDRFVGFAEEQVDNSAGAAAALNVRVIKKGAVKLSVTGAVITDVGQPVYAQDDNAFYIPQDQRGLYRIHEPVYVSSGVAIVEFDAGRFTDPHDGYLAETIAVDKTLDAQDSGKVFFVTVDAKTITLGAMATVGIALRVVNAGAYGQQLVTVHPDSGDGIAGPDIAPADDGAVLNTKATANRGTLSRLVTATRPIGS
jgi:hypothetical protein